MFDSTQLMDTFTEIFIRLRCIRIYTIFKNVSFSQKSVLKNRKLINVR